MYFTLTFREGQSVFSSTQDSSSRLGGIMTLLISLLEDEISFKETNICAKWTRDEIQGLILPSS